jgi:hypothetical protein
MQASDWIAIVSAVASTFTAAIAIALSYISYRRTQDINRQEIRDRRRSQARLITAWWTRVEENSRGAASRDAESTTWPEETGYRIWLGNSSDEAAYGCAITADAELTDEGVAELGSKGYTGRPYMIIDKRQVIINAGTLPPRERLSFRLDRSIISSIGKLTIEFRDANGVEWRRVAGVLDERSSESVTHSARQLGRRSYRWLPRRRPARELGSVSGSSSSQHSSKAPPTADPQ